MPEIDSNLVKQIAQQVLDAMQATPRRMAGDEFVHASPAPVRPPIGVCTGDYSKFPELRAMAAAGGPPTGPATPSTPATQSPKSRSGAQRPVTPLTGFVTARQIDAAGGRDVYLAFGAKLTPLARDRAKEVGVTIHRVVHDRPVSHPPKSCGKWAWFIDGQCSAASRIVREREQLVVCAKKQLVDSLQCLAKAIHEGQRAGGIYFVPSAARAACYANRCASIRAVVGTCGQAVEEGLALLGANVLILEYPHHGYESMAGMVERFTTEDRDTPRDVADALKELSQCV